MNKGKIKRNHYTKRFLLMVGETRNTPLFMQVFRTSVLNLYSISRFYGFYFTLLISLSTMLNRINSEVNFKGDYITTVSQSPLVTDFIVVRQLTSLYTHINFRFYRCLPTFGSLHPASISDFRCQPHR